MVKLQFFCWLLSLRKLGRFRPPLFRLTTQRNCWQLVLSTSRIAMQIEQWRVRPQKVTTVNSVALPNHSTNRLSGRYPVREDEKLAFKSNGAFICDRVLMCNSYRDLIYGTICRIRTGTVDDDVLFFCYKLKVNAERHTWMALGNRKLHFIAT